MSDNKIPSPGDFERASRHIEEQFRNLSEVLENVKERFSTICQFSFISIIPQGDKEFLASIIFKKDRDLLNCKSNGITAAIEDAFYEELERYGRGMRGEIKVVFVFDSNKNVCKNYGGYSNYMR